MIFVGLENKGFFADQFAERENLIFNYVNTNPSIIQQTNDILRLGKQDYTIFDIEQYIEDSPAIASQVKKICNSNGSKAIILAEGYLRNSNIIVDLAEQGISYFIFATTLAQKIDQLEKCLNGFYDANGIDLVEELKEEVNSEMDIPAMNSTSIAIAGACNRIGTTTHAIQIVRYLQLHDKKACYIQMNNSSYMKDMKEWFTIRDDEELGMVTFQEIDHFYKLENIKEIMKMDYEYFIYDYGVYFNTDFNKVSFLEKDNQIFVVGSDQSEMTETMKIINSSFYDSGNYLFNFTSEADQKDIIEMMEEKADQTFFSEYVPDKYVYIPNDIYTKILPLKDTPKQGNGRNKKKGFFKKKR